VAHARSPAAPSGDAGAFIGQTSSIGPSGRNRQSGMSDTVKFAASDPAQRADFLNRLVDDIAALESMLANGLFETGVTRIGAEQEMCLVDSGARPAMVAPQLLELLADEHFTTELARFNLELNLDPGELTGGCLAAMQSSLEQYLARAGEIARRLDARILLAGILPSIRDSDIVLDNITPAPRYRALNDALRATRGSDFSFYILGLDELIASNPTVLYEACNTSFQVHFQIDPSRFASHYNWAQAIAAPILSCATNSPLLLGKRLWRETRIALFHLATDNRGVSSTHRQQRARVSFGTRWETGTVADYFKELAVRYKALLTPALEENSLDELERGTIPRLRALGLLNGTVYPWNRPCYGITGGKPHIRIESRYLPAGPSIVDEVANAALWVGLMNGMPDDCANLPERMRFESAHDNFLAAARMGLGASFEWLDRRPVPACQLLLDTLLPIARAGLDRAAVAAADIDAYLGIIEKRVASGKSGSQWMLDSMERVRRNKGSTSEAVVAITQGICNRQRLGDPVHEWLPAEVAEAGTCRMRWSRVDQLMSTDLITVRAHEPVKLVKSILRWSHIRHLPVETDAGELLGMISTEYLLQRVGSKETLESVCAGDVMDPDPPTAVGPDTSIEDALSLMTANNLTCLAVLANRKLVGIVTERDCLRIARGVLDS
jgi:CBS domain-containing protein